jgi:uncharacterized membrane protein HdeD (DUF308 family)
MERDLLNVGWKLLLVRGVIAILFGIVAIAWPVTTAIALALLWGFWALFDGVGSLVQAFQPESRGSRVWLVIMGLVALVAAFFAIFSPAVTAVALTWILGIWLIVRGVFEAIGAFSSSTLLPRWLLLLGAALSLLLGVLFVANPGRAAVAIAVWLGVTAIVWGGVFVAMAIAVRRGVSTLRAAPGDHPLTT